MLYLLMISYRYVVIQLQKMSKPELKAMDKKLDFELNAKLQEIRSKYLPEKLRIVEVLLEKEVALIRQKVQFIFFFLIL